MRVTSFEELSQNGWVKRVHPTTKRVSYVRPNKTIVNQRKHLSDVERDEIGHILFPGRSSGNVAPLSVSLSAPTNPLSALSPSLPSTSSSTSQSSSTILSVAGESDISTEVKIMAFHTQNHTLHDSIP